jgi:NAD(P)-dependent dehydrogenase (short-subunit alcohol dehydrogenase family)
LEEFMSSQRFVIVGGTSGMGRAVAEVAHANGAQVLVVGRDADKAERVAGEIGDRAQGVACDLTDPEAIKGLGSTLEHVDHLVLSSAALVYAPFAEMSVDEARKVMDGKFWGYFQTVQTLAPKMPPAGSITMFSGLASDRPGPGTAIVTAVNAAVEGLVRSLAVELSPIRVNGVSPGVVDTEGWVHLGTAEKAAMFDQLSQSLPAKRVGQAKDIADAVWELTRNGYTTGEIRHVDGGGRLV